MSSKHIIAHTETEIVFKCYITESNGGTIDLSVQNDMTKSTQLYVAPTSIPDESSGVFVQHTGSRVQITELWWGCKHNKHLDIARIIDPAVPTLHNHYYLVNAGHYDYTGFSDRIYANKDIRITSDGPAHLIIKLRKEGWASKIETAQFSIYDDINAVGS
jgi:hypothetical protein